MTQAYTDSAVVGHFIDNQVTVGESKREQAVYNPATGAQARSVVLAEPADVNAAVAAAARAWPQWANTPAVRRARVMFRFLELLNEHQDELAAIITAEHGKVFSDAQGEVMRGIEVVEFACGAPQLLKSGFSEQVATGLDNWVVRQPLGVVAGITPFNFPCMVPCWMFPLAIVAGNTFILKPSERDPSAALFMAKLLEEAGLPKGVFNVVQGDKVAVDTLLEHPDVQALSFVGSTPIAQYIYETGARHGKRVQALGGAKNHMLVMPDADMDQVVDGLIGAAYASAGERCMAISVAVLVGDSADEVVKRLDERAKEIVVGDGMNPASEMGPVITAEAKERIEQYSQSGVDQGAELLVDGRGLKVEGYENGFFVGPTLFDHVTPKMKIYQEKTIGPVSVCMRVPDFAAGVELINNHSFANDVTCYIRDGNIDLEFGSRLHVGMVGINVPIPVPLAWHGFGGWKASLFGDLHTYGEEAFQFYTRQKSIMQRWPESIGKGAEFGMPSSADD